MAAEKKLRIGLSTHAFETLQFDVHFNHLACVAKWAKDYDLVFIGKQGLQAAQARNLMTDMAIKAECTHMFFMDADHIFPMESLPLLLENQDDAMISGLVCKKGEGFPQVAWMTQESGNQRKYVPWKIPLDGGVYEVGVCAFGCTLINLEKLQKLDKPFFRDTCEETGSGSPDNIRSDVNICNMFREKIKERVFIDSRVLIGHYISKGKVIYPQNAEMQAHLDQVLVESRKLREGQIGVWFDVEC